MPMTGPARLCAAALLTALLAAAPAWSAEINDLGAFPNPFSPNGDGVYDQVDIVYTLSDSARVEVDVFDSLGTIVRNLNAGDWEQGPGQHAYTWYGLNDGSQQQPDGRYTLSVSADGAEPAELVLVVDTVPALVSGLSVQPSRFTPDGDGLADSTLVSCRLESAGPDDRFWAEVVDPVDGSTLDLLTGVGADSVSVYWDGSNSAGGAAADTVYTVIVRTMDTAGNADERETLVDLDTAAPVLTVHYAPDPAVEEIRVASNPDTTVVGTAYDRAGVKSVEMSVDGGDTWSTIHSARGPLWDAAVEWSHLFVCEECDPGVRDDTTSVMIRAHDATLTSNGLGHYNTSSTAHPMLSFDIIFDVAPPIYRDSYTEDQDATYEVGQRIRIKSFWDAPGYTMEADFSHVDSAVDSMFDMTGVTWSDLGGGEYRIDYTTSTGDALVPVYNAPVWIRAIDMFGRAVTDTTVTVSVVESSSSVPGLSVSRNAFDPSASESVKIALGQGGDGARVQIYNMAGVLVRTLESGGAGEVTWSGKNESGEIVASGVYFLHITTAAGDATRSVAVVK